MSHSDPVDAAPVDLLARAHELLSNTSSSSVPSSSRAVSSSRAPRLMISMLTVENFKSYAGQATIGPFHSRFSSVVGPNGSGKSNVIDALLFVFGYKASRMRQESFTHLIHKSAAYPNLQDCSVTIHFQEIIDESDDSDHYTVVPNSQFTVTHQIRKLGSTGNASTSTYKVNGKSVKMNEVQTLLKSKGIDLDNNRFLILQGEVEQISLMKPKAQNPSETGMLEYLEDIIGSNQYCEAIDFIGKEIDRYTEERTEKLNRVKLVEKEKEILEPAMREAKEFLLLQSKKLVNYGKIYQIQRLEAVKSMESSEKRLVELDQSMAGDRARLDSTAAELDSLNQVFSQVKSDHDQTVQAMERCKNEFQAFERKDVKYREDLNHKKSALKKIQGKISKLESLQGELKEKCAMESGSIGALEGKLNETGKRREMEEKKLEEQFDAVRSTTGPIREKLEALNAQLRPVKGKFNEAQSDLTDSQNEAALIRERESESRRTLQDARLKLRALEAETEAKQVEQRQNLAMLNAAKNRLQEAQKQVEECRTRESTLNKRRVALAAAVEEKASASAMDQSRNLVLQTLKKAKIPGFEGRLGDLGSIDPRYDCAASTAAPQLNHVVVQNMRAAQEAIKVLKKTNAGRVTCIVLDKLIENGVKAAMDKSFAEAPENAPRLFDLIKPMKEEYRVAFYFALKDTLVADNLTSANRIAFSGQRFRVVTLDGKLIEKAGTMTGGGAAPIKGLIKLKSGKMEEVASQSAARDEDNAVEDSAAAQAELKQVEQELSVARSELSQLELELKGLDKTLSAGEMNRKKVALALDGMASEMESLKANIAAAEKNSNKSGEDERRLNELTKMIEQQEKAVAKAQKECEKLETEINRLESQIMDAGGAKLKAQKELVDQLTTKFQEFQSEKNRLSVSIETNEKKMKKNEKELVELNGEAKKTQEEFDSLSEEFRQLEEQALVVMEAFQNAQAELKTKEESLEEISKKFEVKKATVAKLQSCLVEIEGKSEEIQRAVKDAKAKVKHWEGQLRATIKKLRGDENQWDNEDQLKSLGLFTADQISKSSRSDLEYATTLLEEQSNAMKPNMKAIEEFELKEAEFAQRVAALDAVTSKRDEMRKLFESLRKKRLEEFMSAFTFITLKLKEMYQMLTLGGDAELELVDSLDPFSEGIVFSVRPPKKSWKNIQNLSGGEKTLSSLALVFALHQFKPTPLYVMDEIDAALDFRNVSIVANYIKERTKDAQFIIISLRNNMFELADRLVGIYKTHDCTKSITIDPSAFTVPGGENRSHPQPQQQLATGKAAAMSSVQEHEKENRIELTN